MPILFHIFLDTKQFSFFLIFALKLHTALLRNFINKRSRKSKRKRQGGCLCAFSPSSSSTRLRIEATTVIQYITDIPKFFGKISLEAGSGTAFLARSTCHVLTYIHSGGYTLEEGKKTKRNIDSKKKRIKNSFGLCKKWRKRCEMKR